MNGGEDGTLELKAVVRRSAQDGAAVGGGGAHGAASHSPPALI